MFGGLAVTPTAFSDFNGVNQSIRDDLKTITV